MVMGRIEEKRVRNVWKCEGVDKRRGVGSVGDWIGVGWGEVRLSCVLGMGRGGR